MSVLALINPNDLLAIELRETLDRRPDLWRELRLLATSDEDAGALAEVRGAATVVQRLGAESLAGTDVVFFCGGIEGNRPLLAQVPPSATAVVMSPDAGPEVGHPVVAGVNLDTAIREGTILSPHPGVVLLAHLLHPLLRFAPYRITATLLQPVSTHGRAGLDEVFEQTRAILTFQSNPPRAVFNTQMAFNLLPAAGAPTGQIEAHLQTVLGEDLPVSVAVVQAGVFHSYAASVYVELDDDPGEAAVAEALGAHPFNEVAEDPELLGPIDAAARDEVLIGPVTSDPRRPGGYRLWAVMDNLTCGGARNALLILEAVGQPVTN